MEKIERERGCNIKALVMTRSQLLQPREFDCVCVWNLLLLMDLSVLIRYYRLDRPFL